jgi:hypothetical protein
MNISDVWTHKMNDTMYDENYTKEWNASSTSLLRQDGFSIDKINSFKDINGRIQLPDPYIRDKNRRSCKKNDFPTEEELQEIEKDIDNSPIHIKLFNNVIR